MTDETATVDPEPTTTEPQGDPDGLGDAGRRAIEAERTARREAEKQLKAINEQLEAATMRATAFEAANGDLTNQLATKDQQILRQSIGLAKGLPPALIERLRGDDEAALTADADQLLALLPQTVSSTPRPDPSQGSRGPSTPDPAAEFGALLQRARGRS